MKRILGVIFALVFIFTGCNTSTSRSDEIVSATLKPDDIMDKGPQKGGTLNLFSTKPDTLNPLITSNLYVEDYLGFVYEPLIKLDPTQKTVAVLADKWEVSLDGLLLNIHIRPNVLWQDGTPFTASDVEFTFETILNAGVNSVYKKNLESVASFAAVDQNNFRIILKAPDSMLAERLTFPIISKQYFSGAQISKPEDYKNMTPMGTGPYLFLEFKNSISLKANPKWWNSNKPDKQLIYPLIDNISIKIFEKSSSAVDAFLKKEVDVIPVDIRESNKYSIRSDTVLRKYTGRNFDFLAFNNSRAVFWDKIVKQAISMTIERDNILSGVLAGEATASDFPVMPSSWIADSNNNFMKPDLEKAKRLLDENGWKEYNGVRSKRIGNSISETKLKLLVNNDNQKRLLMAERIKLQLAQIGVVVQIISVGWDEVQQKLTMHDMVLTGVKTSQVPDLTFMYGSAAIGGKLNIYGYNNAQVDQLLVQMKSENDATKLKKSFAEIGNLTMSDVPYIGMCFYNNAMLYSKKVRGGISPYVYDRYYDISEWYLINQ